MGSGPILALAPPAEYTFMIYGSPVGSYFKGNQLTPIKLKLETGVCVCVCVCVCVRVCVRERARERKRERERESRRVGVLETGYTPA